MIRPLSYLDWRDTLWQYLMTVVSSYPDAPSQILKKKMYIFISDLPSMVPDPEFRRRYTTKLGDFPVSPYLDSRESLSRWLNFFRKRIAESYNEPVRTEKERWEEYVDALGPRPPAEQHHPRWYALVSVGAATAIVVLLAMQSSPFEPKPRRAPWS
jgi:hypothetical protein